MVLLEKIKVNKNVILYYEEILGTSNNLTLVRNYKGLYGYVDNNLNEIKSHFAISSQKFI